MDTYEMDDLQERRKFNSDQDTQAGKPTSNNGTYSAVQVWALAVASLTLLITVPLLFFPRFLVFLVGAQGTLTPLEQFLSYQLGVLLLAVAAGSIMAVCSSVMLYRYKPYTSLQTPEDSSGTNTPANHPLMTPVTICAALSSLIAWNSKDIGSLGVFVCVGTGIIGAWGFWTRINAHPLTCLAIKRQQVFKRKNGKNARKIVKYTTASRG
ncbi:14560_t:CDS:2 [Acaulospora colombiana]|uniref:14560_t:CDS:1 n=1 Tax=Acaulospora colombiana TaxID=27376 RepID=A0ACA9N596_9GLOM|nr:14560_t:CDS:2 [Acaulospora colombiana]